MEIIAAVILIIPLFSLPFCIHSLSKQIFYHRKQAKENADRIIEAINRHYRE